MSGHPHFKVVDWRDLTKSSSPWSHGSNPNNPNCVVRSSGCSANMYPCDDMCYWHKIRAEQHVVEGNCECKEFYVLKDDMTALNLREEYTRKTGREYTGRKSMFYLDKCVVCDYMSAYVCCYTQDVNEYVAKCGNLLLCENCISNHNPSTVVKLEEHEEVTKIFQYNWPHWDVYLAAVEERFRNGEYVQNHAPKDSMLTFETILSQDDFYTINSARDALTVIAEKWGDEKEVEWWLWVAGWYEDCPRGITKHVS